MLPYYPIHNETKTSPSYQITPKTRICRHPTSTSLLGGVLAPSSSLQGSPLLHPGTIPSSVLVLASSSKEGPGKRFCIRGALFGALPFLLSTLCQTDSVVYIEQRENSFLFHTCHSLPPRPHVLQVLTSVLEGPLSLLP